jgi:deoxyribodipyrimidine photo-lyase
LRGHKVDLYSYYQSGLFLNDQIPFNLNELPDVFTKFRKEIESREVKPIKPSLINQRINAIKSIVDEESNEIEMEQMSYPKSSFPISEDRFFGGEDKGFAFLESYFRSNKPSTYKKTRNELMGIDFSTKFSPWLASGYISARQVYVFLLSYELNVIKNESTYWIFFELLWREYFRLIFKKYGKKIFHRYGLGLSDEKVSHSDENFELWKEGRTDSNFINAGMKELKETGFLSNRMRQIVASYLVNELSCDWRAGAAWFESQLIDYDVSSNHCNWAYIAGHGTDPRGGRHFNIQKQKSTYDPYGSYEKLWC